MTTNTTVNPAISTSSLNISLTQIRFSCWTGEKQVSDDEAETLIKSEQDSDNFKVVKKLIDQDALKQIKSIQSAAKREISRYSHAFKLDNVIAVPYAFKHVVEGIIEKCVEDVDKAVDVLIYGGDIKLTKKKTVYCPGYERLKEKAREELGSAYNEADYPTSEQLRNRFRVLRMPWFDLSPGDAASSNPLAAMLAEFKEEASAALRQGFLSAISKVVERLEDKYDPESGCLKRQVLHDSMLDHLNFFVKFVDDLNIGNDQAVAQLATDTKAAINYHMRSHADGTAHVADNMAVLRDSGHFRKTVRSAFERIVAQFNPVETGSGKTVNKKTEDDESLEVVPVGGGITIKKKNT